MRCWASSRAQQSGDIELGAVNLGAPEGFSELADFNHGLLIGFAFHSPILLSMSRYDRPTHKVFMTFFFRSGWQVQFVEADLKTPLPRQFRFGPKEGRKLKTVLGWHLGAAFPLEPAVRQRASVQSAHRRACYRLLKECGLSPNRLTMPRRLQGRTAQYAEESRLPAE
jgi:hypothetical protein